MKHTRQVNALEARKWMVANPGKECLDEDKNPTRWNPALSAFEWNTEIGSWHIAHVNDDTYTITEETEEPKCEECERLREQRDHYKRWNLANEDACIRQAEEIAELQKQLAELKAEKRKGYEWKNCGKSFPVKETIVPLRRKNGDLALGRRLLSWSFLVGYNWIGIPDPENWEYLKLEE